MKIVFLKVEIRTAMSVMMMSGLQLCWKFRRDFHASKCKTVVNNKPRE